MTNTSKRLRMNGRASLSMKKHALELCQPSLLLLFVESWLHSRCPGSCEYYQTFHLKYHWWYLPLVEKHSSTVLSQNSALCHSELGKISHQHFFKVMRKKHGNGKVNKPLKSFLNLSMTWAETRGYRKQGASSFSSSPALPTLFSDIV